MGCNSSNTASVEKDRQRPSIAPQTVTQPIGTGRSASRPINNLSRSLGDSAAGSVSRSYTDRQMQEQELLNNILDRTQQCACFPSSSPFLRVMILTLHDLVQHIHWFESQDCATRSERSSVAGASLSRSDSVFSSSSVFCSFSWRGSSSCCFYVASPDVQKARSKYSCKFVCNNCSSASVSSSGLQSSFLLWRSFSLFFPLVRIMYKQIKSACSSAAQSVNSIQCVPLDSGPVVVSFEDLWKGWFFCWCCFAASNLFLI